MRKYEIMFIVRTDIDEKMVNETSKSFEDLLKSFKSTVTVKELGQKKLAYEIEKQKNGYYFLFNVEAPVEAIKEFTRKAEIDENIIRHLVVKLDEE